VRQLETFARDAIDLRRLVIAPPVTAQVRVAEVVGEDEQDVGLTGGACAQLPPRAGKRGQSTARSTRE
jgi:hypothetical protein